MPLAENSSENSALSWDRPPDAAPLFLRGRRGRLVYGGSDWSRAIEFLCRSDTAFQIICAVALHGHIQRGWWRIGSAVGVVERGASPPWGRLQIRVGVAVVRELLSSDDHHQISRSRSAVSSAAALAVQGYQ